MKTKPHRKSPCAICGGTFRPTKITHQEKRGPRIYLFEHVPAKVCTGCGEVWIDETTLREIDRLIREGKPVRKIVTPVYDFAVSRTPLRRALEKGYVARAASDRAMAERWLRVDEEAWEHADPRNAIEKDLAEAEADVKAGRVHGPFKTARALVRAAKRHARRDRRAN